MYIRSTSRLKWLSDILDSSLCWVSSDRGVFFRSPCLPEAAAGPATAPVVAVAYLGWAHLEAEEGEERLPLAQRTNQDLVGRSAQAAARYFSGMETGCFTLLAVQTEQGNTVGTSAGTQV